VKVNVSVTNYDANKIYDGVTSYQKEMGDFVYYNDMEGNIGYFAPLNKEGEVGFDVELNGGFSFQDVPLANEAGDVMYRMEYPQTAIDNKSDKGKTMNQYLKSGGPGAYSMEVEETYKKRKEDGTGKDPSNNPYPLKNTSSETGKNKKKN